MTDIALPPAAPVDPMLPGDGFGRSRSLHNTTARIINRLVIIGCYASALLTIVILFLIFGYILYRGVTSINLSLFTELPGPAEGSRAIGMRNCISGTLVL